MVLLSKGSNETKEAGKQFALRLKKDVNRAVVLCLIGDLGAGKTTFVQGIAEGLGITEVVQSPTFVLEKRYVLPQQAPFSCLIHIDAYRIENEIELQPLGFVETISDPEAVVVIEWPKQVGTLLPEKRYEISFRFIDEQQREIVIPEI